MTKEDTVYQEAAERLNTYIDAHGLRHTQEREWVLRHVCALHGPFSAEHLIVLCREEHISPATVYNTLSLLTDAHILYPLNRQYGHKKATYELLTRGDTHLQIICTRCGRVADFRDTAVQNLLHARRYSNFLLSHFSLYVYGTCKVCRRLAAGKK